MLLPFVVDPPNARSLEQLFHVVRGGGGGEVHIFWLLPVQQVPHSTACYPQLVVVFNEQF